MSGYMRVHHLHAMGLATTRVISCVHTRLVALHTPRGIIHTFCIT